MVTQTPVHVPLVHITDSFYIHRGHIAVFGGVLIHLSLGTLYTFGNMLPYLASYMASKNGNDKSSYNNYTDLLAWVYMCMGGGQALMMPFGGKIEHKLGPTITSILGGWLMAGGVTLTYFTCHNFIATLFTYGICFGFGIGIAYPSALVCGMKWFPHAKGFVNGIILFGFGTGAFVFDQVMTKFINPNNRDADKHLGFLIYPEVLDRVPYCFLLLGISYASLQLIGALLLKHPPTDTSDSMTDHLINPNNESNETISQTKIFDNQTAPLPVQAGTVNTSFVPAITQTMSTSPNNSDQSLNSINSDSDASEANDNQQEIEHVDPADNNKTSKQQQKLNQMANIPIETNNNLQPPGTGPSLVFDENRTISDVSADLIQHQATSSIQIEYGAQHTLKQYKYNKSDRNVIDITNNQVNQHDLNANTNNTNVDEIEQFNNINNNDEPRSWTIREVIESIQFWQLFFNFFFNGMCVTFVSTQWKELSINHMNIGNDSYLSVMGAVSSLFNGGGRILWGIVLDKCKSYRLTMMILASIMTAFLFTWPLLVYISKNSIYIDIFSICWLCVLFLCAGGNFAIFPTTVTTAFGKANNGINLGLVFLSQIPANAIGIFAFEYVRQQLGYVWMSWVMSFVSACGLIVGITFRENKQNIK